MNNENAYALLRKPSWAPPLWLMDSIWTIVYMGIIVSFGMFFWLVFEGDIPALIALPFVFNLAFNAAFNPIQFGLQNQWFASVDIMLVLATLALAIYSVYPYEPWIAYSQAPYFVWVAFVTILQINIASMNR